MKTLKVHVNCQAYYESFIEVPDDMTLEEAIEYAQESIDEIPWGELNHLDYSDEIDVEMCELFEEFEED